MAPLPPSVETPWLSPREGAVARIALGTMNFGKRTSAADAARILDRAIERGVTLLDTANVYTDGASERIVGKALKGRREKLVVATKVGLARQGGQPEGLSRATVERAAGESLARLGTDYVDVYYLHAPDPKTPIEETVDAVGTLIAQGRVRHLGLSNFASWQILEVMRLCDERGLARPRISQVLYNLLVRQIEIEYLSFARRYPLHTTVYNPLAGGLLAGKHALGDIAAGSRFDKNRLYQKRYWTKHAFEAVEAYRVLAETEGRSLVELSYAWLASAPGVDSILIGPASLEHLDAALDAVDKPLDVEARERAKAVHEELTGTDASYAR